MMPLLEVWAFIFLKGRTLLDKYMDVDGIKNKIEERLKTLGYSLYSIKYLRDNKKGNTLEIIVDRDESINLDDIVSVSDNLSSYLDEIIDDKDETSYTLDVSSLGAENTIDISKLDKYVGKYVNLHLSHPYKGENILEGTITSYDKESNTIILTYKIKTRVINASLKISDIDRARLAIKF